MTDREKCLAIIDNDCLQQSDAIVLLEGDGLHRYQKAVSLFDEGWADKLIFSGGITDYEYGSYPFSDVLPHILAMGVPHDAIIHEGISLNTKEQAIEVLKIAHNNHWKRLILVASHEHQYRAYLTFLRQVIDHYYGEIILYNSPARNLGWFTESEWGVRFNRLEIEFDRIDKYSQLGDLASYQEVIDYQKWKESLL
jgi:uncharacterized SAM-binding protein YcdF (DUF218 family)